VLLLFSELHSLPLLLLVRSYYARATVLTCVLLSLVYLALNMLSLAVHSHSDGATSCSTGVLLLASTTVYALTIYASLSVKQVISTDHSLVALLLFLRLHYVLISSRAIQDGSQDNVTVLLALIERPKRQARTRNMLLWRGSGSSATSNSSLSSASSNAGSDGAATAAAAAVAAESAAAAAAALEDDSSVDDSNNSSSGSGSSAAVQTRAPSLPAC
jgi:hypothetical protein